MTLGVSIRALAKGFDGKTVLSDVSLEAPPGRSTVLIGPSAAGKTVLLRCVLGLEAPDRGEVALGGAPPGADGLARVGVLFQRDALFDGMTVWENVAFRALQRGGGPRRAARERALALLADVGLTAGAAALYPAELSGGMRKRAGVARAMADDPELLVLDDPTAGLDPPMTNAILDLIERHAARTGATVLAVTGDMAAARARFDRIVLLQGGVVRWAGEAAEAEAARDPWLRQMLEGRADGPIAWEARA